MNTYRYFDTLINTINLAKSRKLSTGPAEFQGLRKVDHHVSTPGVAVQRQQPRPISSNLRITKWPKENRQKPTNIKDIKDMIISGTKAIVCSHIH